MFAYFFIKLILYYEMIGRHLGIYTSPFGLNISLGHNGDRDDDEDEEDDPDDEL